MVPREASHQPGVLRASVERYIETRHQALACNTHISYTCVMGTVFYESELERDFRMQWFGPQSKDVLIAQIRNKHPDFDAEAALQGIIGYIEQCWELCHIAYELDRITK